jgi:hypothetical protein
LGRARVSNNKCVAHLVRRAATLKAGGRLHVCAAALQHLLVMREEREPSSLREQSKQARATFTAARNILDLVAAEAAAPVHDDTAVETGVDAEAHVAMEVAMEVAAEVEVEPSVKEEPQVKSGGKATAKKAKGDKAKAKGDNAKAAPPGRHSTDSLLFSSLGSFASGEFSEPDERSSLSSPRGGKARKSRLAAGLATMTPEQPDEAWLPTEEDQVSRERERERVGRVGSHGRWVGRQHEARMVGAGEGGSPGFSRKHTL